MANAGTLTPDAGGRFIALFVGKSGSGKTPAAGSWVQEGRLKLYDFDLRIRGLLGCPWVDRTKIDYDSYPVVNTVMGMDLMFNRLNRDLETLQIMAKSGQLPFKTVVVDSITNNAFGLLKDSMTLTKGNTIGPLKMSSYQDFNFQSTAVQDILSFLKSVPGINIIVTAHIVDTYEKDDPENPMSPSHVSGKKLVLTDKLGEIIPGGFDHVFEFERYVENDNPKFRMKFWSEIARTTFYNMPKGWQDITGKDFYKFMHECIKKGEAIGGQK